ncbi:site-specific integrase [Heliorestis convoluta]|uniref:Site-specific integrase n=1 Tax=Heliorestis convoluta TaxID=356322 RepID=A0A5Q2N1J0_9FIRM|nr:site-specific integrase [Heliorestis convoluta]
MLPQVANAINEFLRYRPDEWGSDVPIFCTEDGRKLAVESWGKKVKAYGKNIDVHVTPYMFRHASALHHLRNGADVFTVQRILGHADLNMTKRYLALTQSDVREVHSLTSPLNDILDTGRKRVRSLAKQGNR